MPRSKKPVWLLFRVVELILSATCCWTHINCFTDEHFPHIFLHCGTFGGCSIMCFLSIIGLLLAEKPTAKMEAITSAMAGLLHLLTVYVTMFLAERDSHLRFLDNIQEEDHTFFLCCRANAINALFASAIYFLHSSLAADLNYSHMHLSMMAAQTRTSTASNKIKKHPQRSKRPLKLYFISNGVENYLNRYAWFRALSKNVFEIARASVKSDVTVSEQSVTSESV